MPFVKNIRKKLRLTQDGIAEKMGCSRSTYCNLESGRTSIFSSSARKFIQATGCDATELVMGVCLPKNQDGTLMQEPDFDLIQKTTIDNYEKQLEKKNQQIESLLGKLSEKEQLINAQERTINNLERENQRMEKQLRRYEGD